MGGTDLAEAVVLSAATGSASFMIVYAEIFTPLQKWVMGRAAAYSPFWLWMSRLLRCPYCTGTWVAMAAVAIWRPVLVSIPYVKPGFSYWPLGYLVSVMAVNGTAMLWVLIIKKALGKTL